MGLEKVLRLEPAIERVAELKREGTRVVFTNGCFDLLHPGHTRYLAEARKLGDVPKKAIYMFLRSERKYPRHPVLALE